MTVKYTFEQLGYSDSELGDLILSLKIGSTKIKDGEIKEVRYKLCYDAKDEASISAIKINGGLKEIVEFSEFLRSHKERIRHWDNVA